VKNILNFKWPTAAFSKKEDQQAWTDLKQSLREQFPNPQRLGCPGEATLKGIAFGTVRLDEAQEWLDHLGHCSACFLDFEKLRMQVTRQRIFRMALAVAAVVLLCSSLVLWLNLVHRPRTSPQALAPAPAVTPPLPQAQTSQLQTAALILKDSSPTRGVHDVAPSAIPHLPLGRIVLAIYLPPHSRPGKYEIRFLRNITDSTPLARFEGEAQLENGSAVMRITPDLSTLAPGTYLMGYRRTGDQWRYSRVALP